MNTIPPILYRGSVKNVRGVVSDPNLLFEFSDRFSVFDWGEMPDQLEDKGVSLAIMGKCFFKHFENTDFWKKLSQSKVLEEKFDPHFLRTLWKSPLYEQFSKNGLKHHAVLNGDDKDIWKSPHLEVKNINIYKPKEAKDGLDYSFYKSRPVDSLVPLEIIFRLGLVPGNSLSKRIGSDFVAWNNHGFDEIPKLGFLNKPYIDFSTKLEKGDRYLSKDEAINLSGLSFSEHTELTIFTQLLSLNLYLFHKELNLELWDGKIEVAFIKDQNKPDSIDRCFMLVDSVGIDELRLRYNDKSFSKEFLREVYKTSKWFKDLEASKTEAQSTGGDFKLICQNKFQSWPLPLSPEVKKKAEALYRSFANEVSEKVIGERFFGEEYNLKTYSERYL